MDIEAQLIEPGQCLRNFTCADLTVAINVEVAVAALCVNPLNPAVIQSEVSYYFNRGREEVERGRELYHLHDSSRPPSLRRDFPLLFLFFLLLMVLIPSVSSQRSFAPLALFLMTPKASFLGVCNLINSSNESSNLSREMPRNSQHIYDSRVSRNVRRRIGFCFHRLGPRHRERMPDAATTNHNAEKFLYRNFTQTSFSYLAYREPNASEQPADESMPTLRRWLPTFPPLDAITTYDPACSDSSSHH